MTTDAGTGGEAAAILTRGVGTYAALGCVLGGLAGTVDWPLVGTLFGAVEGTVAGGVVGTLVAGLLLRAARSRTAARLLPGAVTAAAGLVGLVTYSGPVEVPMPLAVVMVLVGAAASAALGPMVACGVDPASAAEAFRGGAPRALHVFLGGGGTIGSGLGAVGGLAIGVHVHWPTAPFAVLEGAIFGGVSGVALGCIAGAVWVLPRLRSRR